MAASVGQILDLVNELAPTELAESYDNVGLLLGHPERRVERVLAALDATPGVIEEARALDVQLLITPSSDTVPRAAKTFGGRSGGRAALRFGAQPVEPNRRAYQL